jgi:hypothetical protein
MHCKKRFAIFPSSAGMTLTGFYSLKCRLRFLCDGQWNGPLLYCSPKKKKDFFSAISKNSFFCHVHAGRFAFLFSYSFLASVIRILSDFLLPAQTRPAIVNCTWLVRKIVRRRKKAGSESMLWIGGPGSDFLVSCRSKSESGYGSAFYRTFYAR